jgi:hypothetical protein
MRNGDFLDVMLNILVMVKEKIIHFKEIEATSLVVIMAIIVK